MAPLEDDPFGTGKKPTEYDRSRKASPSRTKSAWCVAIAAVLLGLLVFWLFAGRPP
jgi:hypothetical protein